MSTAGPTQGADDATSNVSHTAHPSVLGAEPTAVFEAQPSFGFCWHPQGVSIVTNRFRGIRRKEVNIIRFAEQTFAEALQKVKEHHNLDTRGGEHSEAHLSEAKSAWEATLADRFDKVNKTAGTARVWLDHDSRYYVVPNHDALEKMGDSITNAIVKKGGEWTDYEGQVQGAMASEKRWDEYEEGRKRREAQPYTEASAMEPSLTLPWGSMAGEADSGHGAGSKGSKRSDKFDRDADDAGS
jgi:hypothetical protein